MTPPPIGLTLALTARDAKKFRGHEAHPFRGI